LKRVTRKKVGEARFNLAAPSGQHREQRILYGCGKQVSYIESDYRDRVGQFEQRFDRDQPNDLLLRR